MNKTRLRDPAPALILASQSKGRAALLRSAGYAFHQIPAPIDEPAPPAGGHLDRYVLKLACLKAEAVAEAFPRAIVIGADTALIIGKTIIGKPGTLKEACRMLALLGGRKHRISSAACILFPAATPKGRRRIVRVVDTAHVVLRKWSPARIRAHVALTQPLSWAGAYAVQDSYSAAIVERIEGDLATVIGLPMRMVDRMLVTRLDLGLIQRSWRCGHRLSPVS